MLRRRPGGPEIRLAWQSSGAHFLFHYTTTEGAAAIAEEASYVVSSHINTAVGSGGLFLTNIEPGQVGDRELLTLLWSQRYGEERVRGVVVIRRDREALAIVRTGPGEFVVKAGPNEVLDLTEVLVGFGIRVRSSWTYSAGLYVPGRSGRP
jgi:hypothetical protein